MVGRVAKRLAVLALAGVGLTLASCNSTGFAGAVYMSPDNDGKRNENVFFADYATSPKIYFIVPIVSGRNDEFLNIYIKVRQINGDIVDPTGPIGKPILVVSTGPGKQPAPTNVSVEFPDPPQEQVVNPADLLTPLTIQPPRAFGKFQFIASMGGDTEAINFEILPSNGGSLPSTPGEPLPGTCQVGDPKQGGNIQDCPQVSGAHVVQCCTAAQVCGIGVEGTGICY